MYDASSVAIARGKKVIDTREGALHFPRTDRARLPGPRFENKTSHRRRASRRGDDRAARGAFLSREPIRLLLRLHLHPRLPPPSPPSPPSSSSSYSAFFLLRETTKAARRSRGRRRKTHSYAAVRERETIPVEEGPFCPAHPTRGFRRPWSH